MIRVGDALYVTVADVFVVIFVAKQKPSSGRRYDYIEYENGRILGKKKTCSRGSTKVDSWWRYLFWHCSYCFCVCDEQGYGSDRYFSLKEVVSNIEENKVVTGLRFRKVNRVMHLQIQQGVLGPQGTIIADTVQWKNMPVFKITDKNVTSGVDYHTLDYLKRAIDLSEVIGKPGQVVTGLRFVLVGGHLNLEARFTEFNFESGKLVEPHITSVWRFSYYSEDPVG